MLKCLTQAPKLVTHGPRRLERKRDVIERPIDGQLDINGWDLRKALRLFRKALEKVWS